MRAVLARQWPITMVMAAIAVSMFFILIDRFRVGSVLLAASVWLAFLLRLVLNARDAGLLAVRSKTVDTVVLGFLGLGLGIMSLWVPPPE